MNIGDNKNYNKNATINYLVIGNGRIAKHFLHYFNYLKSNDSFPQLNSIQISHWYRPSVQNATQMTGDDFNDNSNLSQNFASHQEDPDLNGLNDLKQKIQKADFIFLWISDSNLEQFFKQHLESSQKTVIHASGALDIPGMISIHPLMTFSLKLYETDFYKNIPLVVFGDKNTKDLGPLMACLPNPVYKVSTDKKSLYHAWCVMGGNFPVLLWTEMQKQFQQMGLPLDVHHLYLQQVMQNFLMQSGAALTGPIARKDINTIEKNLQALQGSADQDIYLSFLKKYFPNFFLN